MPSLSSQKPEEPDCSGSPSGVHTAADGISGEASSGSHEIQTVAKKWPEHLWKRHPKSQLAASTARKNNQSKGGRKKEHRQQKQFDITPLNGPDDCHYREELYHTDYCDEESPLTSIHGLSEDSQTTQPDSSFIQFDQNVDVSPGVSPLSLDSCDFSIQMFTDISSCAQAQKNMADVSESLWTDIVDLFNIGSKDSAGCVDVEAYFESADKGGSGQVSPDERGFAHQSEGLTEMCSDRSEMEEENEYGYNWNRDQGLAVNHFRNAQSEDAVGMWLNSPEQIQSRDVVQNQLTPSCCHYSQLYQRPQLEGACMQGNNLSFTLFEGVAQSFSAPLHHPEHPPVLMLPQDEDSLFTDILKDRRSPSCQEQMCFS